MSLPEPDAAADCFDVRLPPSPYPGLRPFEKREWPIFFGRERMIGQIIRHLVRRQLIVVHGDSGCGKSSIIRAGVLASLEQEGSRGGLRWRTCTARPGHAPLQLLAEALAGLDDTRSEARVTAFRRALNFGADAPAELVRLLQHGVNDHTCILIDQFEELFSFVRRQGPEQAQLLIQILVALLEHPQPGLYVVLTMRSEFLGACAQYSGFAEAVNRTQYLLPRMDHADLVRAIREPAQLYGGFVSLDLAERLITDAGSGQDVLPLIQHGLAALCRSQLDGSISAGGAEPSLPRGWRLELADYQTAGDLAYLLSKHADDAAKLEDPGRALVVERLFRALTDINAEGQAIRRRQTLDELERAIGTTADKMLPILDDFRAEGTTFLSPYAPEPIEAADLIDISHEALIRCWTRIAHPKDGWLGREFRDGLVWRALLVQTEAFERDPSSVLSPSAAGEQQAWLEDHGPGWAERHGGQWTRVRAFVDASVEAARRARRAEQAQETLKKRLVAAAFLVLALFTTAVTLLYRQSADAYKRAADAVVRANKERSASIWNRLDFNGRTQTLADDELNALWELSLAEPDVKKEFVGQLSLNPDRLVRLARRPVPVMRAVALRWSAPEIDGVFDLIMGRIRTGSDVRTLTPAAMALAEELSSNRAESELDNILSAVERTPEGTVSALGHVAEVLVGKVSGAHAEERQTRIVAALESVPPNRRGPLMVALGGQASRVSVESAHTALAFVISTVTGAKGSRDGAVLGRAGRSLAARLDPARANEAFGKAIAAMQNTIDPDELNPLQAICQVLAFRLTREQAEAAAGQVVAHLQTQDDADQLAALGMVAHQLMSRLAAANTARLKALAAKILGSMNPKKPDQLVALSLAVAGAGPRLMAPQTLQAFRWTVAALSLTSEQDALSVLRFESIALARRLDGADVEPWFRRVLAAIMKADDEDQLGALRSTATELAHRLTSAQAATQARSVVEMIRRSDDSSQWDALSVTLDSLVQSLSPSQADAVLTAGISAVFATSDEDTLQALGTAEDRWPAARPPWHCAGLAGLDPDPTADAFGLMLRAPPTACRTNARCWHWTCCSRPCSGQMRPPSSAPCRRHPSDWPDASAPHRQNASCRRWSRPAGSGPTRLEALPTWSTR